VKLAQALELRGEVRSTSSHCSLLGCERIDKRMHCATYLQGRPVRHGEADNTRLPQGLCCGQMAQAAQCAQTGDTEHGSFAAPGDATEPCWSFRASRQPRLRATGNNFLRTRLQSLNSRANVRDLLTCASPSLHACFEQALRQTFQELLKCSNSARTRAVSPRDAQHSSQPTSFVVAAGAGAIVRLARLGWVVTGPAEVIYHVDHSAKSNAG
jgi:hypothetical protein